MTNIRKNFIKKFFKENHHNLYILKPEVDINELLKQLTTLINKFGESLKIPLKIDPRILELCKSGKDSEEKSGKYLRKYFTNNKTQFRELYNRTNRLLTSKNGIKMRNLLSISKKNKKKIDKYLTNGTNSELKIKLISEIRLRKFAIECGFETWEQLKNMFRLFKFIYKNRLEKYFNFAINTNESESNTNNNPIFGNISDPLNGLRLNNYNNQQANNNNNNNNQQANNNNSDFLTYNNPRSRAFHDNKNRGIMRADGKY